MLTAAFLLLSACGDQPNPLTFLDSADLDIAMASHELGPAATGGDLWVGESMRLEVTFIDSRGRTVTKGGVKWSVSDPSVAVVDRKGTLAAVGPGHVTVHASAGKLSAQLSLTVLEASAVEVTPSSSQMDAGESLSLTAIARNRSGQIISGARLSWESLDDQVASVVDGRVQSLAQGVARIVASAGDTQGESAITVGGGQGENRAPSPHLSVQCNDLTCAFDGSASTDDGVIVAYAWSFGDGTSGEGVAATHTYPAAGSYEVRLSVTDDAGAGASADANVSVGIGQDQNRGYLGISMPGAWRPFNAASPWNTPIPLNAPTHVDSDVIMGTVRSEASNVRFGNSYLPPMHVIDSDHLDRFVYETTTNIYSVWDKDHDDRTDDAWPATELAFIEPTGDGHLILVDVRDTNHPVAIETSRAWWETPTQPRSSTFNVWDLNGPGWEWPVDDPSGRWRQFGGRGSGFPIIAGLIRPEEIEVGEVRHALVFTFSENKGSSSAGCQTFVSPPGARSDGRFVGRQYPAEGMLLQLVATEADLDRWGLGEAAKIVARAMMRYGMYNGDNGGAMAVQLQLLGPDESTNRSEWDARFPDLYRDIRKIPTDAFRVVDTGYLGAELVTRCG
jgi:chitodextrinase